MFVQSNQVFMDYIPRYGELQWKKTKGFVYYGEMLAGILKGRGIQIAKEGLVFEGLFDNNLFSEGRVID